MSRLLLLLASISRLIRGEISTRRLIKMGLVVGKGFSREGGVRIDASYCHVIKIGDYVTLAPNVHILAHDASLKHFQGFARVGKVTIGNRVFVGANSVILPNCAIGDNVIVGAGSVVTKDISSNSVCAGNPARFICSIDDFIKKNINLAENSKLLPPGYSAFNLKGESAASIRERVNRGWAFQECDNRNLFKDKSA